MRQKKPGRCWVSLSRVLCRSLGVPQPSRRAGCDGAQPWGRESLAIWTQGYPRTLRSPEGRGERSPSFRSGRRARRSRLPASRSRRSPILWTKSRLLCAPMPNRKSETDFGGRERWLDFSAWHKGRHSRLAPQGLCPPPPSGIGEDFICGAAVRGR